MLEVSSNYVTVTRQENIHCFHCGQKMEINRVCYKRRKSKSKYSHKIVDRYYCSSECFWEDNDDIFQKIIENKAW